MNSKYIAWIIGFVLLASYATALQGSGTPQDPYNISSCPDLNRTRDNLNSSVHYQLTQDIDCDDTKRWDGGSGFDPIGDFFVGAYFNGTFDGQDYDIINLTINRTVGLTDSRSVALFSAVKHGEVKNLGLVNVNITGKSEVGGIMGILMPNATLSNSHVSGTVTGISGGYIGCLIGDIAISSLNDAGLVISSSAFCTVSGDSYVGGLIGDAYYSNLTKLHFDGSVTSTTSNPGRSGGISGGFLESTMEQCYSAGTIRGDTLVGGLTGQIAIGLINNSYSTAMVIGNNYIGGITGQMSSNTKLYNSYSKGLVVGSSNVGGLVGSAHSTARCNDSFWDNQTSNKTTSACTGAIGKPTYYMNNKNNFTDAVWDMGGIWGISGSLNEGYPYFKWQNISAKYLTFSGTNFNAAADINSVPNAVISKSGSSIEWNNPINVAGADFDSNMVFDSGFVSMNSSKFDNSLNTSATVTISVGKCQGYIIYYAPNHHTNLINLLADPLRVNCITGGQCTDVLCNDGIVTFTASHFDGYGSSGGVPEFSTITLMLALIIVASGFIIIRKGAPRC